MRYVTLTGAQWCAPVGAGPVVRHYRDKFDTSLAHVDSRIPRIVLAELRSLGWKAPYVQQVRF